MNELLKNLNNANVICNETQPYYERANQLQQQMDEIDMKTGKAKKKWIILGVISWFVIYELICLIASLLSNIPVIGTVLAGGIGLAGMVGGIALAFLFASGRLKAERASAADQIAELSRQKQEEMDAAEAIFEDHAAEMDFLPSDYWYPMATAYFIKAVKSGRADSLGEAIDKFEEHMHRMRLEEANAQLIAQQEQQTAHLRSIRKSSKVSAAANVTNTVFNIASRM